MGERQYEKKVERYSNNPNLPISQSPHLPISPSPHLPITRIYKILFKNWYYSIQHFRAGMLRKQHSAYCYCKAIANSFSQNFTGNSFEVF